jgi:hypothetical protein
VRTPSAIRRVEAMEWSTLRHRLRLPLTYAAIAGRAAVALLLVVGVCWVMRWVLSF